MRIRRLVLLWVFSFLLCLDLVTAQDAARTSVWGEIITVGTGHQGAAPAFLLQNDGSGRAVWVADAVYDGLPGIFHLTTDWRAGEPVAEPMVLALPAALPQDQRMVAAAGGRWLMFWRDAAWDAVDAGPRLWVATFTAMGELERGPFQLSETYAGHYTFDQDSGGTVTVVWSGEPRAEPALFIRQIDRAGRPRPLSRLMDGGDWPVLLPVADTSWLYWLAPQSNHVQRALVTDVSLGTVETLVSSPILQPGDRLDSFDVASDSSHVYAFWNLTRIDGTSETWMTAAPLEGAFWPEPRRLGLTVDVNTPYVTGFNGGAANIAAAGDLWVAWANPVVGQTATMLLAVQHGDGLGVVYMRGGVIVGYQPIVMLDAVLVGVPALYLDRDRHLTLLWSAPVMAENGAIVAQFHLTTTRHGR